VRAATLLRLRPFDGHENFSTWQGIRRVLRSAGCSIVKERGLHLFPFQLKLDRLSTWCDEHLQSIRGLMINICVLARKQPDQSSDQSSDESPASAPTGRPG
jgi:hypothetical protein